MIFAEIKINVNLFEVVFSLTPIVSSDLIFLDFVSIYFLYNIHSRIESIALFSNCI